MLGELKKAKTLKRAHDIRRELDEALAFFSPKRDYFDFRPPLFLWGIIGAAADGALPPALSGGKPLVGAAVGVSKKTTSELREEVAAFCANALWPTRRIRFGTMSSRGGWQSGADAKIDSALTFFLRIGDSEGG